MGKPLPIPSAHVSRGPLTVIVSPDIHFPPDGAAPFAVRGSDAETADHYDVFTQRAAWSWRPSIHYFRKAVRESYSRERAVTVALVTCDEHDHLWRWACEHEAIREHINSGVNNYLAPALRASSSHPQAILLGLLACFELERLWWRVWESGYIPPKWIVADEEAEVKRMEVEGKIPKLEELPRKAKEDAAL